MMVLRFLIAVCICVFAGCAIADSHKRVVVFDIDGTLTPSVYAIGIARDDAAKAVQVYADAGVTVIYLTARVPLFQDGIAAWLVAEGFPDGVLHLTQTDADQDDHGAFKARVLAGYVADGWTIVAAYGDSSSDFEAYAASGIPQDRVFALERFGTRDCKAGVWQGCYEDWADLIPLIPLD